jgi:hypothetical protein
MTLLTILGVMAASLLPLMVGYFLGLSAGAQERERIREKIRHLEAAEHQSASPTGDESESLKSIQEMLAPLVERERISIDLSKVNISLGERRDLSRLLDTIASVGHFGSVLLSNEEGLPLAANREARNAEQMAAFLTRLAMVTDQTAGRDGRAPVSILIRDALDETTLCRVFYVRGQRLFLAARSSDARLTSVDLDPALTKVEAALSVSRTA